MTEPRVMEPRESTISTAGGVGEPPRHRWYFVKEGFSPSFVAQVLEAEGIRPGELLMDPFSGGGTVPLTGVMANLRVEACEVNPFLHFSLCDQAVDRRRCRGAAVRRDCSDVHGATGDVPLEAFRHLLRAIGGGPMALFVVGYSCI